jgi:hypothetical protein
MPDTTRVEQAVEALNRADEAYFDLIRTTSQFTDCPAREAPSTGRA